MTDKRYVLLLIFSVFVSALSQVLLKKSATEPHNTFIREYLNIKVISAYLLFFTAVFMDIYALKRAPASFVPVVETSGYAFAMIFGKIFFKEKINKRKAAGMMIIVIGIMLYVTE
ncbi:MAG: DMT family transporter [Bacteroides sp.]|nr:DMT family transporter [Prevotella sp.]MCM1407859.1 DMT family transporter [Treponema brennaborense]MCM1469601.1 DMT family transporter [Bacteroides sp.]